MKIILSDQELQVIKLIALGKNITEIAQELSLSESEIMSCRSALLKKTDSKSNVGLALFAVNNKIVTY